MKTIKRKPGMELNAKYITRDKNNADCGLSWSAKPKKNKNGLWQNESAMGWMTYIGKLLKPGEISRIVP